MASLEEDKDIPPDKTYFFYRGINMNKNIIKKRINSESYKLILEKNDSWFEKENCFVMFSDVDKFSYIKTYLEGVENYCVKHLLAMNLKRKNKDYALKTITLHSSSLERDLKNIPKNKKWFLKKSGNKVSNGSYVAPIFSEDPINIVRELIMKETRESGADSYYVLQESVNNPMLIDGFKFDIRFYGLLIFYKNKLNFYTYEEFLLRFALEKYNPDLIDPDIQLTNTARGKDLMDEEILNKQTELIKPSDAIHNSFIGELQRIAIDLIDTLHKSFKVDKNSHGFMLIGFDMISDDSRKMYLLESNKKPALYEPSNINRKILHKNLEEKFFPDLFKLSVEAITNEKLIDEDCGEWIYHRSYYYEK